MNKLLFLEPIYSFTVTEFIEKLNAIDENEDVEITLNSPGGSVFAGWTLIGELANRKGKVNINVGGHAASFAPILLMYADNVKAYDITQFMLHKADMWVESDSDKELLAKINDDFYKKMKSKIDNKKLKEIKGVTLKEIFEAEKQTDTWLTAQEAKEIGLINEVVTLKTKKDVEAFYDIKMQATAPTEIKEEKNINNQINIKKMDIKTIKAEHTEVYNEIVSDVKTTEKDRVNAWIEFIDIDRDKVINAINDGKELTAADLKEFATTIKKEAKTVTATVETETKENKDLEVTAKDEEEKIKAEAKKDADDFKAQFGIKTK